MDHFHHSLTHSLTSLHFTFTTSTSRFAGRRQEVGSGGTLKRLEHSTCKTSRSTCKTRRSTCKTRSGWRLRRLAASPPKNIKEIPLKLKSKIYEKLKIWNFNVNFQKKSLEKLSHQNLKFCQKIPYGGSILLIPFLKTSCRNGDFDFFLSAPQKFVNF